MKLLRTIAAAMFFAIAPATVTADAPYEHIIARWQWPQHANGQTVSALPAVREAVRRFKENGRVSVFIRYPGGDPGRAWANEVRGWLVSFGIPTAHLALELGAGDGDRLIVGVIDRALITPPTVLPVSTDVGKKWQPEQTLPER